MLRNMRLLDKMLRQVVRKGELTVIDHDGKEYRYGSPDPNHGPVTVKLTDRKAAFDIATHPRVARVLYPGLENHPGHAIANRQMRGPGGMISFDLRLPKAGVNAGAGPAIAFLKALRVFTCAESLGGVESLAELPAVMTHASRTPEARETLGIGDGLIRLSVGLEDVSDLRADLERGFHALST